MRFCEECRELAEGRAGFVLCEVCTKRRAATLPQPSMLAVLLAALEDSGRGDSPAREHLLTIARRDWVVQVLDSAAQHKLINDEGASADRYPDWWPDADARETVALGMWHLLPESERERIGVRP